MKSHFSCLARRLLTALGFLASAAALPATILSIDDGTAENSAGLNGNGQIVFLNSFATAAPGATQVLGVQIAFGAFNAGSPAQGGEGMPITVYLWSDPNNDGNPSDAQVLASTSGTITNANTNTFLPFSFSLPTTVSTQNFFVGFLFTQIGNPHPGAFDTDSPFYPDRSFLAGTIGGDVNPNALGAAGFLFSTNNAGLSANWLIRADVNLVPEPSTWALALGGVGLMGLAARRRRLSGSHPR